MARTGAAYGVSGLSSVRFSCGGRGRQGWRGELVDGLRHVLEECRLGGDSVPEVAGRSVGDGKAGEEGEKEGVEVCYGERQDGDGLHLDFVWRVGLGVVGGDVEVLIVKYQTS